MESLQERQRAETLIACVTYAVKTRTAENALAFVIAFMRDDPDALRQLSEWRAKGGVLCSE